MKHLNVAGSFLILAFLSLPPFSSSAQSQTSSSIADVEKIYLHTDRNQYAIGEDIWYKAYMVYAYTNTLFDHSKLLYVELISPESEVVLRNVTRMDLGLGHGDIVLSDSSGVEPGTYLLRAYTNWTRNFGDQFMFEKEIVIVDLREEEDEVDALPQAYVFDVQFFPEGGSLLDGVASQVGFISTYANGDPCKLTGKIRILGGSYVTDFESVHNGMGSFVFTPSQGETYIAVVIDEHGNMLEVKLPAAAETGYTLSAIKRRSNHIISIKTNAATLAAYPNSLITLRCATRGVTYMEGSQQLSTINHTFILPTNDFPEGISRITLFDSQMRPHGERLIYVEKESGIEVMIATDKSEYGAREKVDLGVSVKKSDGSGVVGSFSVAVTDANVPGTVQTSDMNICSYFLMQSDIKGRVHEAGAYFDLNNPQRDKQMGLLLLTQGWRDFVWKTLPSLAEEPKFKLEKDIRITGRLRRSIGNIPIKGADINMVLTNKGKSLIIDEVTDDEGRFLFDDVMFTGYSNLLLTNQDKNYRTLGNLSIDSLFLEPHEISYKVMEGMETSWPEGFREEVLRKHIEFQVPLNVNTMLLEDLVVRGTKINSEVNEPNRSIYGTPENTYKATEQDQTMSNIFIFMQKAVPGLFATGNSVSFARGTPLLLLDGVEINGDILSTLLPSDIDRVESIKNSASTAVFGARAGNGLVAIYTKEGYRGGSRFPRHSINHEIQGYYDARVFFSINYEETTEKSSEPDIRNTLYWNPYLQPDVNGTVSVSYHNADMPSPVTIVVEGITDTGIPLVKRASYQVK